jgi:hypothetical protein
MVDVVKRWDPTKGNCGERHEGGSRCAVVVVRQRSNADAAERRWCMQERRPTDNTDRHARDTDCIGVHRPCFGFVLHSNLGVSSLLSQTVIVDTLVSCQSVCVCECVCVSNIGQEGKQELSLITGEGRGLGERR